MHSHFFAVGTLGERVEAELHPLQPWGGGRKRPLKQTPATRIEFKCRAISSKPAGND